MLILTVLAGIAGTTFGLLSCSRKTYAGPTEPVSVAYSPYLETAFYWIAEDQHYFIRNGLDVTFRKYDSLVPAVDDMLKGAVDIVGNVTEFPLASRALQKARNSTIASVARSQTISLVGRKDRGIAQVSDLKRKRVGSIFGTITDFYLGRLLELNGMNLKDITRIDVKSAAGAATAIVNGDVDAVVVGQPYANAARDQLGANAFFESAQSRESLYALALSTNDWIASHPQLVTRFLESLSEAEDFFGRHPAEAMAIIRKRLNLDQASLDAVWAQYNFSLSLDQPLILAMEDEARWAIGNGLTDEKTVPNFLNYIYTDALKAVKPEAVMISGR